jgi:pyridoxamine 5'-phosphate oxidase
MRHSYDAGGLSGADLASDWMTQFTAWLDAAVAAGLPEPNAMVLATASADGRPSARTVLLKRVDKEGFSFFTNYGSRKGAELAVNPYASLVFPWIALHRQVVVVGSVRRVGREGSAEYFRSRPRGSQVSAWASRQSSVVPSRGAVEAAQAAAERRFGDGEVPLPDFWGGFLVVPETVEFWQGRPDRLHDRLRFRTDDGSWVVERLSP